MGIVPQRTEAIRENHRNIEMKAYGVLTSLILLFSLASAADIQQQLAKENAKLESIRHYINNMKIPLESLGIDLENLQGGGNANTIIDGILSVARAAIVAGGYDNVALPEGSFGFNHTLWPFGRVFGGVRLYNGFFKGMGNINRIGDATAKTEKLTMLLESRVGIVDASLGYSLSITFLDIGPKGSMSGNMQYSHFFFKVRMNVLSKVLQLDDFSIEEIGPIRVDIHGLGFLFNWLAEEITDFGIYLFKGLFASLIEGPIKTIINDIINNFIPKVFMYVM